jgi:glycosyltransferase involved in cell wall biosynthesis
MKNKRIKILYLITGLNIGGTEMVLYRFLKRLNREKYEPLIVSIVPIGEIGKRIKREGFLVLSLNAKFKLNPFIFWKFILILKKEKPDILQSFLFHGNFLGRIAGKLSGVPVVISCNRNINIGGWIREQLIRYTGWLSDFNTANSQIAARELIKKKVYPKEKLKVIYNGIDVSDFDISRNERIRKELKILPDKFLLISVGSLTEQKGYPYLIEAVKMLIDKYPGLVMIILGEGPKRESLQSQIERNNLKDNILLLGNKDNVAEYLSVSDLFVLPSLWEGLPNVLLEAMASGLASIATDVGGVSEIIQDEENGFLVNPKNSAILYQKIDYALSLPKEEREVIGKRAKETISDKFSLQKMVREYENLYSEMLNKLK